jgi:lipopolysaccharide biosynthesis regulator YciM
MAEQLETRGAGVFSGRMAHYRCEMALEAEARGDADATRDALRLALAAAPEAARPRLLSARHHARQGRPAQALAELEDLLQRDPERFVLALDDYASAARDAGRLDHAQRMLADLFERQPSVAVLRALCSLQGIRPAQSPLLDKLLERQPSLSAVQAVLEDAEPALHTERVAGLRRAVQRAATPLQRYRCAHCGFEAQRHFWQCPGCLSWDSFPPRRIEQA